MGQHKKRKVGRRQTKICLMEFKYSDGEGIELVDIMKKVNKIFLQQTNWKGKKARDL